MDNRYEVTDLFEAGKAGTIILEPKGPVNLDEFSEVGTIDGDSDND